MVVEFFNKNAFAWVCSYFMSNRAARSRRGFFIAFYGMIISVTIFLNFKIQNVKIRTVWHTL